MSIDSKVSRLVFTGLFSLGLIQSASADPKSFYYERYLMKKAQARGPFSAAIVPLEAEEFEQRINPQDPNDSRMFKQRYYINSDYASGPDAPVLYYICGEATCQPQALGGAVATVARQLGAHRVALEHRYYGLSQPFPTLTSENLKFLTTPNAIEDLARFQRFAIEKYGWKGKWIAIGGSYAGSLAAYYRLKHPELVVGALASSGPVRADDFFEEYDQKISEGAGPECGEAMREVVRAAEQAIRNPEALALLKRRFEAENVVEPVDFLYVLADMAAIAIQYGRRDFFCKTLLDAKAQGDPIDGYAKAGKAMFSWFGITAVEDSFQGAESLDPSDYVKTFGMRQWLYQSCTEYGYWQVAHPDSTISVRSTLITQQYHNEVCRRLFGLEQAVDVSMINKAYYEPLVDPRGLASRILFTNGLTDPWSALSIQNQLGNHTNPAVEVLGIEGAAHCDDLRGPNPFETPAVTQARDFFLSLAKRWVNEE